MDDDMRKSLLNKKSATFDKQYEQCTIKIQRIKQKNDFMQKQVGTDVQQTVKNQVTNQRKFIEKEIKQLKGLMDDMDRKFKDPQSRNKLKNLKMDAQKQIQRNKIIMKDFINKSFMRISQGSAHSQQDANQYMETGQVNFEQLAPKPRMDRVERVDNQRQRRQQPEDVERIEENLHAESLLTDQGIDMDFEIERKILQEKNELLNQVEQTTMRVNEIMNDMAIMVDQQGQNLQIISEDMMNANKNLIQTNKELDQANHLQKKSRRKYCLFALLLVVLIAAVLGIIFLTKS